MKLPVSRKPGKIFAVGLFLAVLAAITLAGTVTAAEYPSKPIKMLIGFSAGGGIDTLGTVLSKEMEKVLGQPVVKQIKAGGGGGKAAASLKTAKADGYTIAFLITGTFAFNPAFRPKKTPYTRHDFDYLATVGAIQEAVIAKSDAPFQTWPEMIAYAKKGNKLSYAGVTPYDKLMIKYLNKREGIKIRVIPTKGASGALKNILGGHTQLGFAGGSHLKPLKAGLVIVLASLRAERLADSPKVPTLLEQGYPLVYSNSFVLAAPKGLPADVRNKLASAINKAAKSKTFQKLINKMPFIYFSMDQKSLTKLIDESAEKYEKFISEVK